MPDMFTALWEDVALSKQTSRNARIPPKWRLPTSELPNDPSRIVDGPQNVFSTLRRFLTREELHITDDFGVADLLQNIACANLSAVEVIDAFCHRASLAHQFTNCLTEPLFEQAAERARFLDTFRRDHGCTFGPLHGLPVSIKDTLDFEGVDSSTGLAALCNKPATQHAPLVYLLLSLGAIIVAKTNVPQTLASLDSNNNVFGRTMNPINRLCTAGGSSGGEGVMVALRGSMIGIGSDLGGSIRIPAMANGVYGFRPSVSRLPYGGQAVLVPEGMTSLGIQPVVGPLANSIADIDVVMKELVPRAGLWGEDCISGTWTGAGGELKGAGLDGRIVIGVLRSDGNCGLLPPIDAILSEVATCLQTKSKFEVVELPTPHAWSEAQDLMGKLINIDGGILLKELLDSMQEPLMPWMQSRFKATEPSQLVHVAEWQARRAELEKEMLQMWFSADKYGRRVRRLDAIICPVAPHPVPGIDSWGTLNYTSVWNLFDQPSGTIPVRNVAEQDLQLGQRISGKSLGPWDDACRELWDEELIDRRIYLETPLSVQVVVPRLEDGRLCKIMTLIDEALRS